MIYPYPGDDTLEVTQNHILIKSYIFTFWCFTFWIATKRERNDSRKRLKKCFFLSTHPNLDINVHSTKETYLVNCELVFAICLPKKMSHL